MEANQTKIYELRGGKPALASTHDYLPGSPDILLISEKKNWVSGDFKPLRVNPCRG